MATRTPITIPFDLGFEADDDFAPPGSGPWRRGVAIAFPAE
jgi:hypothetical protein